MTVLGELHFSGGDDNTSLTILLAFNNSKEKGQGEGNLYKIHHTICAKPYMDSESHKRYRIYYTVRIHIDSTQLQKWAYSLHVHAFPCIVHVPAPSAPSYICHTMQLH